MVYVSFVRFVDEQANGINLALTLKDMWKIAKEVKEKVLDLYYNTPRWHGRLQEIESKSGIAMTTIQTIIARHQQELRN